MKSFFKCLLQRKTCIFESHFLRAIINIYVNMIKNMITYLDRNFKEEQNDTILNDIK
jgi:hypothetical protein